MVKKSLGQILLLLLTLSLSSCKVDPEFSARNYKAEKIIVVVIDGPRYSETWGDSTLQYMPFQKQISKNGVLFTSFFNYGVTNTVNGHTAITTGTYESLDNNGNEIPMYPSYFQVWRKVYNQDSARAWIVTSKDKLEVLKNCSQTDYANKYMPSTNCGNNGLATGYRNDIVTLNKSLSVMKKFAPDIMLIQFKEPDASGHAGDWNGYLNGIRATDSCVKVIYDFINKSKDYKDKTALFITNDHGRHLDTVQDGFVSHGCSCNGCRHISLLATGPDFEAGTIINAPYGQTDLTATIAEMLHIRLEQNNGSIIKELFNK